MLYINLPLDFQHALIELLFMAGKWLRYNPWIKSGVCDLIIIRS